jgi:hypothetical protein
VHGKLLVILETGRAAMRSHERNLSWEDEGNCKSLHSTVKRQGSGKNEQRNLPKFHVLLG